MPPLEPTPTEWLAPLSHAISIATGRKPGLRGVPFGTDAGPLSATGTPCVVFGPGDIAQAHTRDEWVDLDQVAQAAEAYFRIAVELGQA
jgi:acetylornithine deacetylase/succinyl-diaminopimelate desuccinylase-like protein